MIQFMKHLKRGSIPGFGCFSFCSAIIMAMTGTEYEDWCAEYLKKLGFHHIRKTKASNDQGIDLIAKRRGLSYGFQCKYYSSNIGNDAVQQAYAGMTYYGLDRAAVITNRDFTPAARRLAEETGVELFERTGPEEKNMGSLLIRIPAFIVLILSLIRFYSVIRTGGSEMQSALTILAFAFFASLASFLFADHYGALVFAAVSALIHAVSSLSTGRVSDALTIASCVLLILLSIRIIVLKKGMVIEQYEEEKAQLSELISESRAHLSDQIARLLSRHLETSVSIREIHAYADGRSAFVAHSRKPVGDQLEMCEETLNQYAQREQEDFRFEIRKTDAQNFTVYMKKKEEETD